jgi:ketosteroid isomerase-like protein
MSQKNVEIVRALYARWNAGDRSDPAEYCDPEVELESPFSSVVGEPYRGYAGMRQWIRDVDEQFSEWRVDIDDTRALGDTVVAVGSVHGQGRASRIEVDLPMAWVTEFGADHRVRRARIYLDVDVALKAVGLAD